MWYPLTKIVESTEIAQVIFFFFAMVVSKKMLQTPSPSICFYVPIPTAMIWHENCVCVCVRMYVLKYISFRISMRKYTKLHHFNVQLHARKFKFIIFSYTNY